MRKNDPNTMTLALVAVSVRVPFGASFIRG
jgi:hypothetical protein